MKKSLFFLTILFLGYSTADLQGRPKASRNHKRRSAAGQQKTLTTGPVAHAVQATAMSKGTSPAAVIKQTLQNASPSYKKLLWIGALAYMGKNVSQYDPKDVRQGKKELKKLGVYVGISVVVAATILFTFWKMASNKRSKSWFLADVGKQNIDEAWKEWLELEQSYHNHTYEQLVDEYIRLGGDINKVLNHDDLINFPDMDGRFEIIELLHKKGARFTKEVVNRLRDKLKFGQDFAKEKPGFLPTVMKLNNRLSILLEWYTQ